MSVANDAKVLACNCVSPYQDSAHGKGMRVHTTGIKKKPENKCTVCSRRR